MRLSRRKGAKAPMESVGMRGSGSAKNDNADFERLALGRFVRAGWDSERAVVHIGVDFDGLNRGNH